MFLNYKLKTSKYSFIVFVSLILIGFFNIYTITNKFININNISQIRIITGELLICFALMLTFLYLFSFSKIIVKLVSFILILITASVMYFNIFYKVSLDPLTIASMVYETDQQEVQSFIEYKLILWFLFFGLLPAIFLLFFTKINTPKQPYATKGILIPILFIKRVIVNKTTLTVSTCLIVSILLFPEIVKNKKIIKNTLSDYLPINYIGSAIQFIDMANKTTLHPKDLTKLSKKYPFTFKEEIAKEPLTIILVIGESARADHFSLNGYNKKTNPLLEKTPNVISFPNVSSCGTLTRVSVACILSPKSRTNFQLPVKETNLVSVFKSLGFYTYYISSHSVKDEAHNSFYTASYDADEKVFSFNIRKIMPANVGQINDSYLFSYLNKAIAKKSKHKFILLHTIGSHTRYEDRYPSGFSTFTPDCKQKYCENYFGKNHERLLNTYDNTIVYTDYFLHKVISKVKNQNAIVFYVSDHGQYLGENGRYFHSGTYEKVGKEVKNVAQIVWVSDSIKKLLGNNYKNIVKHKNTPLSHDNVFHSMFNCLFISSSIVDKNLSICN